ncbi:MAG: hypothetical protein ACI9DK_001628 [Vicingaceae bacterium]|jgi:hypothetical protein
MKKLKSILIAIFIISGFSANAQGKAAKSPAMETKAVIGNVEVIITYCSPSVRDREIFGGLEPFGKVWRAGANEATTMSFSNAVTINGSELAAGTYSFFVTPSKEDNWEVIFNSEAEQWGVYKLNRKKDVLISEASVTAIDKKEKLKYSIEGNFIHLDWDTKRVSIRVN